MNLASQSNYRYVGSVIKDDVKNFRNVVLSYDMFGNHPKNPWMSILYADGHVSGDKPS
jgi:prepilin-type processing-associated H-X9-DG protein